MSPLKALIFTFVLWAVTIGTALAINLWTGFL